MKQTITIQITDTEIVIGMTGKPRNAFSTTEFSNKMRIMACLQTYLERFPDETIQWVQTVTDAPVAYDGFGTKTVQEIGTSNRNQTVRLVATPKEHVEWQRARYGSGNNMAMPPEQWDEIASIVLTVMDCK